MPRIDLLTAQMRQRSVNRVSIAADERIKLFGEGDQFLGAGAALSSQVVGEILQQIAPGPLDGQPVSFPYSGRDGQFEISVAPGGRAFDVRTIAFASPASALGTSTVPATSSFAPSNGGALTPTASSLQTAPPTQSAGEKEWFYFVGEAQQGPVKASQVKTLIRQGTIKPDTLLWSEGLGDWQSASQTEFKTMLPAAPVAPSLSGTLTDAYGNPLNIAPVAEGTNAWFYRSPTGQSVPVEKGALLEKFRSKALSPDTLVWREGMDEWKSAKDTELARDILGPAPGAPIPSPQGGNGGPKTLPGSGAYSVYGGTDPNNTSGEGGDAIVPREARGWFNWGAFLFPVFWCRAHNLDSWAGAIVGLNLAIRFLPFIGSFLWLVKLPIILYLGFAGNYIGWRYRRFESVKDFKRCQMLWGIWSVAISLAFWGLIFYFLAPMLFPGTHIGMSGHTMNGEPLNPPSDSSFGGNSSSGTP